MPEMSSRADRERGPVVLVVVEPEVAARREEDLVVVAAVHRDVRPVDHRLDPGLAVHEDVLGLQHGAVGEQGEADRPLQAAAQLRLADPERLGAVLVRNELPVDRHRGGRAVVVREIPLHAAGDPRAEHADERGLHDVLAVEDLEAGLLVREVEEVPAVLREEAHLEPLVLEHEVLVVLVDLLVVQHVLHRVRVHAALRALVDAPREEDGRLVIPARRVRREHDRVFLHLHTARDCRRCNAGQHRRQHPCIHIQESFHFFFPFTCINDDRSARRTPNPPWQNRRLPSRHAIWISRIASADIIP